MTKVPQLHRQAGLRELPHRDDVEQVVNHCTTYNKLQL